MPRSADGSKFITNDPSERASCKYIGAMRAAQAGFANHFVRGLLVIALSLLAAHAAGPLAYGVAARACGEIVFTPRSEDGVYAIRATNTSCPVARRVARAVRPLSITRGPYSYRVAGYRCRGTLDDVSLPVVAWRCTKRHARVTFTRA